MKEIIKIMIVEDDADFAYLIQKLLKKHKDIEVVGHCPDKKEAFQKVVEEQPDIVLMDLNLGTSSMDGVLLSRKIRIRTDAKVLILTASNTPEMILKAAKEAFASGYIFKNQLSLLVEDIRTTAAGYTPQEYLIASSALSWLSEAERAVFEIMMGKENHLQSSPKTIANQKGRIVKKMGLENQKELLHVFKMLREDVKNGNVKV